MQTNKEFTGIETLKTAEKVFVDISFAMEMFYAGESTIYKWMKNEGLPKHKICGKLLFIREELVQWGIERGKKSA